MIFNSMPGYWLLVAIGDTKSSRSENSDDSLDTIAMRVIRKAVRYRHQYYKGLCISWSARFASFPTNHTNIFRRSRPQRKARSCNGPH